MLQSIKFANLQNPSPPHHHTHTHHRHQHPHPGLWVVSVWRLCVSCQITSALCQNKQRVERSVTYLITHPLPRVISPGDESPLSRTVQKWCTLTQRNVSVRKEKTRSSVPFTPAFMDRKVVFLSFFISSKWFVDILNHRTCIRQSACREKE